MHGGLFTVLRAVLASDDRAAVLGELGVPLLFAAVGAALAALSGAALAARSARCRQLVLGAGTVLLAVAVVRFALAVQHSDHPYHSSLIERLVYVLPCLALAALGSGVRRSLRWTLAVALLGLALADPALTAVHGLYMVSRGGRMRDGFVMQSSPVTCVPAAVVNALSPWQQQVGEGKAAWALHTTIFRGTILSDVPRDFPRLGLAVALSARHVQQTSLDELRRGDLPAVLGVFHAGSSPHAVTLVGIRGDLVAVADPALGLLCAPFDDYRRFSSWQGEAVLIEPPSPSASPQPSLAAYPLLPDCVRPLPPTR